MNLDFIKHFILMLSVLCATEAMSQRTITGSVSDETGETLIGVNILIQGTANGTVTDLDGSYSLEVNPEDVLVFSYTGYGTQTIPVGVESTIDVSMQVEGTALEEVVVTGYGVQRKATLTGSVASIGGAELEKSISPNLGTALAGKVAGLYIDTESGVPGAESQAIRVRGTNTCNYTPTSRAN